MQNIDVRDITVIEVNIKLGDNCIQIFHLSDIQVGNFVLQGRVSRGPTVYTTIYLPK